MAQGRTSSPNYDSSKKPPSANVSHANPPASTQGSNASSSHYHWNQLLNSYLASWQVNSCPSETALHGNALSSSRPHFSQLQNSSHHFDSHPAMNHYASSTNTTCDSGYVAMQNRTAGCSGSENPSTSYCPFNQSSGATFQLGNSLLNSSTGSDNSGMSIGIQATGMSSTATSSAFNQSTSNPPSGLANHPHAYAQMHNYDALANHPHVPTMQIPTYTRQTGNQSHASFPVQPDLRFTDYRTSNEQLNDSNYFGNQSTTTATLPMHRFQNPTAAAYSFQLDQSHFGTPMYSNELSEDRQDRHVATRPGDDTKLEGIDHTHTRDNSSNESNVSFALVGNDIGNIMLGEELKYAFDSDSN
jgi:hypothetical protein